MLTGFLKPFFGQRYQSFYGGEVVVVEVDELVVLEELVVDAVEEVEAVLDVLDVVEAVELVEDVVEVVVEEVVVLVCQSSATIHASLTKGV